MTDKKYFALVDGDILAHELGQNIIQSQSITLKEAKYNCDQKVRDIMDAAGCEKGQLFLTDGPSNFRHKVATIKPYKGNRDENSKPAYWGAIRQHLRYEHNAEIVYGCEADDAMAMEQSDDTVICSRDKDLDQVPGWHYSWKCGRQREKPLYYVTEQEGLASFYMQLIMGDVGDNIPGLYRMGKVKANKALEGCTTELQLFRAVKKMYQDYFGSYWELFLVENARLLYLKREECDEWKIPG